MSRARLVAILFLLAACSRDRSARKALAPPADAAPPAPAPAPGLRAAAIHALHGIYFAPEPGKPIAPAVEGCAGKLTLSEAPFDKPPPGDKAIWAWREVPTSENEPPSADALKYFAQDVRPEQIEALPRSKTSLVFMFHAPRADAVRALRESAALLACVAHETGGLIWDENTRQLFSEARWRELRLDSWKGDVPHVLSHITVHTYKDGELARSVSLGMEKLGLPDLCVNQHARSLQEQTGLLIAVAGQAMWARETLPADGALEISSADYVASEEVKKAGGTGTATVHLVEGRRQEGDAENRLLEIRFAGHEEQGTLLKQLFGVHEGIYGAREDDEELAAARKRAMAKLRALKPKFAGGVPDLTHLAVKAPFKTSDGGVEWMWVEVVSWKGDVMEGLLMNIPEAVPDLQQGARVRVEVDSLFDYVYQHGDTTEGNETSEILQRREQGR